MWIVMLFKPFVKHPKHKNHGERYKFVEQESHYLLGVLSKETEKEKQCLTFGDPPFPPKEVYP